MQSNLNIEEWEAIVNQLYEIEFDWLGVDQVGQLAIFSSVGKAFIPSKVVSSCEKYQHLARVINSLPAISKAILCTKEKGVFDDWKMCSQKGLFAFDYQDIHRTNKLNQYDLICKPESPLLSNQFAEFNLFIDVIPQFNVRFEDDIEIHQLEKSEIR
jgi:hypothetical protein